MSIFGPIVSAISLPSAIEATVSQWIEVYLRETERQAGVGEQLPSFASYNSRPDSDRWIEEAMPALITVVPGLAAEPDRDGEGNYEAPWRVGVMIVSAGPSKALTDRNNKLYAAAVRAILLQQSSLGGASSGVYWTGEDYDQGPVRAGRSIGTAVVSFTIHTPAVVNKLAGPLAPPDPDQPGSEWPRVEHTYVEVDKL